MLTRPLPILVFLLGAIGFAQAPSSSSTLKGYDPNGGAGKTIHEVSIDGTIDLGLAPFVERVVRDAVAGDVVMLKIKTFGGRVDAAVRIRDALLDSKATTVAYIDHRAISAGALIALATDTIIMSPGAAIGAATPVQMDESGEAKPTSEKVVSYMRAEMHATAVAKGRRGDVAEAMVDPDIEVKGVNEKGKLVTLTTEQARHLGIAEATVADYEAAISLLNLQQATRVKTETSWGEKLARMLTDPVVSSLLMSFGFLGLMMEFYTGGHGIGGGIGIICLGLFFAGQYAANLAGWEELLLFALGLGLLLVEILFVPGFGVPGILGLVTMAAGLVMALVELEVPLGVSFELGYFQQAVETVSVRMATVLFAMIAGAYVFAKYLPKTRVGGQFILASATGTTAGYVGTATDLTVELVGKEGRVVGALRPAGIADIEGKRVDVVSDGGFVDAGTPVVVVQVDGNRVVVRART